MTDMLGSVALANLRIISMVGTRVQLAGYYTTTKERDELRELCSKYRAAKLIELLDGSTFPADLSDGGQNLVYCTFDKDEYLDGFYLITGYSYDPGIGHQNFYPYTVTVEYVGTRGNYFRGFEINALGVKTNDFSL